MTELPWLGRARDDLGQAERSIAAELSALAENVTYSGQSQFSLSKLWRAAHLALNTLATAVAGVVGVSSLTETVGHTAAGIGALVAAGLAGVNTALGAAKRSSEASEAGNAYVEIRDLVRQLALVDLGQIDTEDARARLSALTGRVHEVNKAAGVPGFIAWRMARKNIDRGGQEPAVRKRRLKWHRKADT